MGSRPHAVLAYGYDLSKDIGYRYDEPEPDWYTDPEASYRDNAHRALLAAKGRVIAADEYFDFGDSDDVMAICGVALEKLGYDSDDPVILAVKVHKTDWDTNQVIPHFVLPDDVDERLHWALGVLGIDRGERLPEWILASYYG